MGLQTAVQGPLSGAVNEAFRAVSNYPRGGDVASRDTNLGRVTAQEYQSVVSAYRQGTEGLSREQLAAAHTDLERVPLFSTAGGDRDSVLGLIEAARHGLTFEQYQTSAAGRANEARVDNLPR